MTASIRIAQASDADRIAGLTHQLGYVPKPSHVAASLSRILARADQRFVVAELDDRLVGWVHGLVADYVDAEPFALIGGLVVDRGMRRQGVGRRLLADVESWAQRLGCRAVRLTSSGTRTAAHRFYESVGYTNIKTQYSFAKPLGAAGPDSLRAFVPTVE